MIIVNADDWGLSVDATDAAHLCYRCGRITSVSAMVFMADSDRAAELAQGIGIDVGLHLNHTHPFTGSCKDDSLIQRQQRIAFFLTRSKYSVLLFNPLLRQDFRYVYRAQLQEFIRLYGKLPSHVDGHQHKHLCANIIFDSVIPAGEKVRRNFTFSSAEKGVMNRMYRSQADWWLSRRYVLTDYFVSLPKVTEFATVAKLSEGNTMEMMAHPIRPAEFAFLMSDEYLATLKNYETGTYSQLGAKGG